MTGLMVMFALHGEDDVDGLRAKAKDGDVRAMLKLGYNYRDGVGGVTKDERKSVAWFRRAADRDDANAYDNLGFMYLQGRGVPANLAISTGYFLASAEKGWHQGQYNLGMSYFYGRGVKRDYARAAKWWRSAADGGHKTATFLLGYCLMNGYGVKRDEAQALASLESAEERGDADASFMLGEYYYRQGSEQNREKAQRFWAEAKKHQSYRHLMTSADCETAEARGAAAGERQFLKVPHLDQGWNLCGPTSTAVVLRYYGVAADPEEIKRNVPNSPFGTGTAWDKINDSIHKVYGIKWELKTYAFDADGAKEGLKVIRRELDKRHPVVIDIRGADATGGAHTVAVIGYDRQQGVLYLQDTARYAPGVVAFSEADFVKRWNSQGFVSSATGEVLRPMLLTGSSRKR
jgi:hypothetical protein